MAINGRSPSQGRHHRHLGAGGRPEILTAQHIADAQGQLVHRGGQVISDHPIGPPQHRVAHLGRAIEATGPGKPLPPLDPPRRQPQSPARQTALLRAPRTGALAAEAGIHVQGAVGSRDVSEHPPTAAAGVEGTAAAQGREHGGVEPPATALTQWRAIPEQPQPSQVSQQGIFRPGSVARGVEVIDAQ